MLFNGDRRQMRDIFFRAWRRHRSNETVEGIERLIVDVALLHPEYQTLLEDPEEMGERDYLPELGETNPFLHMSMQPRAIIENRRRACGTAPGNGMPG